MRTQKALEQLVNEEVTKHLEEMCYQPMQAREYRGYFPVGVMTMIRVHLWELVQIHLQGSLS